MLSTRNALGQFIFQPTKHPRGPLEGNIRESRKKWETMGNEWNRSGIIKRLLKPLEEKMGKWGHRQKTTAKIIQFKIGIAFMFRVGRFYIPIFCINI